MTDGAKSVRLHSRSGASQNTLTDRESRSTVTQMGRRPGVGRWLTVLVITACVAGCAGSDSSGDDSTAESSVSGSAAVSSEPASSPLETASGAASDSVVDSTRAAADFAVFTAQEVCDIIDGETVAEALGVTVTNVEAGDSGSTPQCFYSYESDTGASSNVTIASMDTSALGGRVGDDAFDFVAEVNRGVAGGTDFEEQIVDAGDRAVRFTGVALHLGIVSGDGHLQTVIVPREFDPLSVDQLLVVIGEAITR